MGCIPRFQHGKTMLDHKLSDRQFIDEGEICKHKFRSAWILSKYFSMTWDLKPQIKSHYDVCSHCKARPVKKHNTVNKLRDLQEHLSSENSTTSQCEAKNKESRG